MISLHTLVANTVGMLRNLTPSLGLNELERCFHYDKIASPHRKFQCPGEPMEEYQYAILQEIGDMYLRRK
jgi:hypothetical protein